MRRRFRDDFTVAEGELATARQELLRTVPDCPTIAELQAALTEMLRQSEVVRVNSEAGGIEYGPRANFLVGGNILGRGLTIDDLLVTYYIREAKVSQMDTVWQHARMYGYRSSLMPFTRVFLSRTVAAMFTDIHRAEEELRGVLRNQAAQQNTLIRVPNRGRATRPNAVPGPQIRTITSDLDQIQPHFLQREAGIAEIVRDILIENNVPLDEPNRSLRSTAVPLSVVEELIEILPVRPDDPGRWSSGAVLALLSLFERELGDNCRIYARRFENDEIAEERSRGRLSGEEIREIRSASPNAPTLVLIAIGDPAAPQGWFPELVLPSGTGQYVTNVD
jgi:hypothetical protein